MRAMKLLLVLLARHSKRQAAGSRAAGRDTGCSSSAARKVLEGDDQQIYVHYITIYTTTQISLQTAVLSVSIVSLAAMTESD